MLAVQRFIEKCAFAPGSALEPDKGAASRGQPLGALQASHLLDRFYAWRGASGERYICSIFSLEEEGVIAGFSQAVAIGVAREAGSRRPVCLLSAREFASEDGRAIRVEARDLGVAEWHVHFGADDAGLRDLADSLLN
jgi:hypothetical protein